MEASTLSAEDASGGNKMAVLSYATALAQNGRIRGSASQKVDQTFNSDVYQQIMQHGMMLHMDFAPPAGAVLLRLAVQDGYIALVGTIDAPLKNP